MFSPHVSAALTVLMAAAVAGLAVLESKLAFAGEHKLASGVGALLVLATLAIVVLLTLLVSPLLAWLGARPQWRRRSGRTTPSPGSGAGTPESSMRAKRGEREP
ncbi:MAG TPA: hypothetical protein VGW35_19965 [Methylomirabilota bacterium]|jgi:hypothetical protein|nr:hypothetical protein [Methylomirabilota bacterium]